MYLLHNIRFSQKPRLLTKSKMVVRIVKKVVDVALLLILLPQAGSL